MTLYAVSSLKQQLEKYLIEDVPTSRAMLEFAYHQVQTAIEFSKRIPFRSKHMRRSDVDLQVAARRLKNALQSERGSEGLHNLEREIHFFTQTMHKLVEDLENAGQLYNSLTGIEEEDVVSADERKPKMIGFSDHYNNLKQILTDESYRTVSLCGMPGIGKTTLARELFEDPDIVERFDCRVWVRVGKKCGFDEILRRTLVEVMSPHHVEEDEDIVGCLNQILKGKRSYLIVFDDVWDKYMAKFLKYPVFSSHTGNQLRYPFPDKRSDGQILVLSRMLQVSELNTFEGGIMEMRLMNEEESWHLLHEIVFAQESCPFNLERIGRKIAEKCEGLPLTIVTVANLLSKEEKTAEYWKEVATQKRHPLFKVAYDETMKVLLPSYNHLPPTLQMCFLFIGIFPLYYEIPRSRLANLWVADGFHEQDHETLTDHDGAIVLLEEIASNNMVMIKKTVNSDRLSVGLKQIKTCRLHSSLWHLSSREARSNKFSYTLDSHDDGFGEDIQNQHRLSFHNNILFAIKDVHESVEDNCASTARSLFCLGSYSQYQVPLCFGLKLLNKLDALTIRFYEFPMEVLQLVELRYLALTLNGNLPAAISQLSKVEFLIIHRHESIKSCEESSYLPMEIWNMKELRHLQVTGKDLPNPGGASLESLSTLSSVGPNSCTVDVFRAIPNLNKLGVQVELSHDSDGEPFSCFDHVSCLEELKSFKCIVVNPDAIPSFTWLSCFPSKLTKLSLNGLGYPWEEITIIGLLESLKMLKLRNYAFQGPEWDATELQFPNLDSLIIEDTDLEIWKIGHENLLISRLMLKHCYSLEEIHGEFGSYLTKIEVVDCNPLGAQQIKKLAHSLTDVIVSCSWHDEKPKT